MDSFELSETGGRSAEGRFGGHLLAASAIAGCVLTGASVLLPWLRVGLGGSARFYTGLGLPALAVAMFLLVATAGGAIILAAARDNGDARDVATLAIGAAACLSGVFLLLVECASAVIPNGLLPAFVRRYTLDLRAGPGLWIAFSASAVTLALVRGRVGRARGAISLVRSAVRPRSALALVALAAIAVGCGVLRYSTWVQAGAAGVNYGIGGWSLPWVGPLSLVAMVGVIVAGGGVVAGRERGAALLAAGSGWLMSLAAALTIVTSDTLASVRFAQFAPAAVRSDVPHLAPATAPSACYALGLAAVAVGAALLATVPREAI